MCSKIHASSHDLEGRKDYIYIYIFFLNLFWGNYLFFYNLFRGAEYFSVFRGDIILGET